MIGRVRRTEQQLVRAADRVLDAPREPSFLRLRLAAAYLFLRQRALYGALRGGRLWLPSPVRLGLALGVTPGDRVLDLGANLGRVSQEAAWRVGRTGSVHAYEPSPAVADRLERRIRRLRLEDRVVVHRCAVGSATETAILHEYAHRDGGASSLRPQEHVGRPPQTESRVPVVTVDDHLEGMDPGGPAASLIKIDVEGAEVEVLAGARRTLSGAAAPPPILVVEAAPVAQQGFGRSVQPLLDTLWDAGYRTWACRRQGLVAVRSADEVAPGRRREDLLALHPQHHAALRQRLEKLARSRAR